MIDLRRRDDTADSPGWVHLGEFYIGIGMRDKVRFAVYRSASDLALHRLTSDEMTNAGPRLIAVLTEPAGEREEWHPAWVKDELRPRVESDARAIMRR